MFSAFGENFKTEILTQSTTRFSELSNVVALVIGILLAFFIIKSIISMLIRKKEEEEEEEEEADWLDDDF